MITKESEKKIQEVIDKLDDTVVMNITTTIGRVWGQLVVPEIVVIENTGLFSYGDRVEVTIRKVKK